MIKNEVSKYFSPQEANNCYLEYTVASFFRFGDMNLGGFLKKIVICPRGTPRVPAPLPLSPFSPPDRDRRVDSPALSARGSDLPGAPQDEAGLTRKSEM